jgi:hypothetical protein
VTGVAWTAFGRCRVQTRIKHETAWSHDEGPARLAAEQMCRMQTACANDSRPKRSGCLGVGQSGDRVCAMRLFLHHAREQKRGQGGEGCQSSSFPSPAIVLLLSISTCHPFPALNCVKRAALSVCRLPLCPDIPDPLPARPNFGHRPRRDLWQAPCNTRAPSLHHHPHPPIEPIALLNVTHTHTHLPSTPHIAPHYCTPRGAHFSTSTSTSSSGVGSESPPLVLA